MVRCTFLRGGEKGIGTGARRTHWCLLKLDWKGKSHKSSIARDKQWDSTPNLEELTCDNPVCFISAKVGMKETGDVKSSFVFVVYYILSIYSLVRRELQLAS